MWILKLEEHMSWIFEQAYSISHICVHIELLEIFDVIKSHLHFFYDQNWLFKDKPKIVAV